MFGITLPTWLQRLFPSLTWKVKTADQVVYLTFDDGPHPQITPWVMHELGRHNALATFFCVGENITKYPETYGLLKQSQHATGNHTYNHLNGWKTEDATYFENIEICNGIMQTPLFRPPYGRITLSQMRHLKTKYRIVMWDLLTKDYDKSIDPERMVKFICSHIQKGSIIVFHDSEKAEKNLRIMLPAILEYCTSKGYKCLALTH